MYYGEMERAEAVWSVSHRERQWRLEAVHFVSISDTDATHEWAA